MTTPQHQHAEILRAIADGKQIQYQYCGSEWKDCDPELALSQLGPDYHSKPSYTLRIKPETIIINGVECPKPLVGRTLGFCVSIRRGVDDPLNLLFETQADAHAFYDALCLPLKSEGKP